MTAITDAAKKGLARNTGFDSPRVVRVNMQGGLYHVIVDIKEKTEEHGEILRTYDVAVDKSGEMHGYMPLASGDSDE